jgi:hypothetical protein
MAACMLRKRCAERADLNRCILRSRRRNLGRCNAYVARGRKSRTSDRWRVSPHCNPSFPGDDGDHYFWFARTFSSAPDRQRFQGLVRRGQAPGRGGFIRALSALGREIGLPRGNSTSRRSPPNEAAPPGPRRLDVEPHLLFERLQVELHEIGETAPSARNLARCGRIARPGSCRHQS